MSDKTETTEVAVRTRTPIALLREVDSGATRPRLAEEQLAYARVLDLGMKLGLLLLVATFALYVSGVVTPHIPVEELPRYWSLPVKEYLAATGIHAGWAWLHMLGRGDFLTFLGIGFLAAVAMVCYVAITPIFFRKKDLVYGWLAILEVVVLAAAASGLLKSGGH